ncbi:unnamed protein product [Peronospora belbahrii]|uniref:Uncharacterized protein n=1 Tax=Peronospora belbahrii TaxID=622444 RepID=A0ABN8CPX4_9STRA|nr:unnamed protein product [Peronospora belbahrii]
MAVVSKSWYGTVNELLARYQRDTMQLTFKYGSKTEILAIRREIQLRGRAVRDLCIRMGHSDGTRFITKVWWWMEEREIPWDVMFSQLPGIKRLDLRLLPFESRHLPLLLEMAAKFCLPLEILILPRKQNKMTIGDCNTVERVMKATRGAMQRLYMKGTCGGLKQLTVPTMNEQHRFRSSTKFIEDVIAFCPNVEYLDGYNHAIDEMNGVTCGEKWIISLDTWERFNKTCTNLHSFDWAVVPFADPFFRVFGEHVKPRLKKLTLTLNLSWDWNDYFNTDQISDIPFEKSGYGLLAKDVALLLKGCPALIELDVIIDQDQNGEAVGTLLDVDLFGDQFWMVVVDRCPLLQSLNLSDRSAYGGSRVIRLTNKFTDRGLLALANHTRLTSIKLPAVCCSGNSVFEYIKHVFRKKPFAGGKFSLGLSLAGPNDHAVSHPFYVELVKLLERLAVESEKEIGVASCSHKASINVSNPHSASVDKDWSILYLRDELKPIMEKVANAHPTLDMHVVLCRNTPDSFCRIDNMELNWCPGSQQGSMFIDNAFVGDTDSNDRESDEENEAFYDEEDEAFYNVEDDLDPHEIYSRRHAMLLDHENGIGLVNEIGVANVDGEL